MAVAWPPWAAAALLCMAVAWPVTAILKEDELATLSNGDECQAAGNQEQCALNALQRRALRVNAGQQAQGQQTAAATAAAARRAMTADAGDVGDAPADEPEDDAWEVASEPAGDGADTTKAPVAEPVLTGCDAATKPCPEGLHCVSTEDGSWSQCITCEKKKYFAACVKWDDRFRYQAIQTCNMTCPDSRCYNENWCKHGWRCAVVNNEGKAGGEWGQCVLCNPKFFKYHCFSWNSHLAAAAGKACGVGSKYCKAGGAWKDEPIEEKGRRRSKQQKLHHHHHHHMKPSGEAPAASTDWSEDLDEPDVYLLHTKQKMEGPEAVEEGSMADENMQGGEIWDDELDDPEEE